MLSVVMLNVIMLGVVMLNVKALEGEENIWGSSTTGCVYN
jgi:hypothetical protein